MARTVIGGVVAGIILFLVGFIFWASPLHRIAYSGADEAASAAIQASLAQNLGPTGTGTYVIPTHDTSQGMALYERGPVATIHFNSRGFAVEGMGMMVSGFLFALIAGLLIAFGLAAVGRGGRSFAPTARMIVLVSVGITFWTILAQPVFNHHGWTYWIYAFVAESTALILAGLAVARWFLPPARSASADAPADDLSRAA
ncbi:hypothetical protein [Allosphingosinicella sp.]|jgi:hypothetical protein|uniref:hypothetical protein n=1 Tax=Allosphingosinicella sp. TaxID=2823234 RepID=UPI002EFFFA2A